MVTKSFVIWLPAKPFSHCLKLPTTALYKVLVLARFSSLVCEKSDLSQDMRFPTMWYVRPAKAQTSLRISAVWSEPLLVAWIFYEYWAIDRTSLEFLSLKGGCIGSSESTLVKMPHCWKSYATAHFRNQTILAVRQPWQKSCLPVHILF